MLKGQINQEDSTILKCMLPTTKLQNMWKNNYKSWKGKIDIHTIIFVDITTILSNWQNKQENHQHQ